MSGLLVKLGIVFGLYLGVTVVELVTHQPSAALVATSASIPTILTAVLAVPEAVKKLSALEKKNGV